MTNLKLFKAISRGEKALAKQEAAKRRAKRAEQKKREAEQAENAQVYLERLLKDDWIYKQISEAIAKKEEYLYFHSGDPIWPDIDALSDAVNRIDGLRTRWDVNTGPTSYTLYVHWAPKD